MAATHLRTHPAGRVRAGLCADRRDAAPLSGTRPWPDQAGLPLDGRRAAWRRDLPLENIIPADFRGTIQCDGCEAYDCFAKERGGRIALAGCLAHVRRKFFDAKEKAPKVAVWFLQHFQNLDRLAKELRKARAGPKLREVARCSLSRLVLARLHRALMRLKIARRYLPQSHLGKAIDYALNQWPSRHVFLEDGRVEIDNNLVENAIRPRAIGQKNWLFIGDAGAGERSAIIYTVIESCRRRGLDPSAYLREGFTRLPTTTHWQVKDLTPAAWAKKQKRVDGRAAAQASYPAGIRCV